MKATQESWPMKNKYVLNEKHSSYKIKDTNKTNQH